MNERMKLKSEKWIEKRTQRYQRRNPKTDAQARKWLIAFPQFGEKQAIEWVREAIIIQYDLFRGEQYKMSILEAYRGAIAELGRRWQQWRRDTQEYMSETEPPKSEKWIKRHIRRYQRRKPKTDAQAREWLSAFRTEWSGETIITQYDLFIEQKMDIIEAYQKAIAEVGNERLQRLQYIQNLSRIG